MRETQTSRHHEYRAKSPSAGVEGQRDDVGNSRKCRELSIRAASEITAPSQHRKMRLSVDELVLGAQ